MPRNTLMLVMAIALSIGATAWAGEEPTTAEANPPSQAQASASVVIGSSDLANMRSIPIIDSRVIKYSISTFEGCPADIKMFPVTAEVSHGKLSPKASTATVTIPGDMDIAIFVEYTNASGGNSISCERALRFHSAAGAAYRVDYTPPHPRLWHQWSCDMKITENRDGGEVPVPSAHDALLGNRGFGNWRGLSNMNVCAERDPPKESKAP